MADGLDRLWAPWRQALFARPKPRGCIFCAAKRSSADRRHHVVARGRAVFAILNLYPYNNGHFMIAPYRHVGRFERLSDAEWLEMLRLGRTLMGRLRARLRPHGFNIGTNLGKIAGAGIPGHLHLHIVPRWNGDTNFMPILGRTKIISQSLDALYDLLARR